MKKYKNADTIAWYLNNVGITNWDWVEDLLGYSTNEISLRRLLNKVPDLTKVQLAFDGLGKGWVLFFYAKDGYVHPSLR